MRNITFTFVHKGGVGSGNFGHSGRPGKVGGSGGGSGGVFVGVMSSDFITNWDINAERLQVPKIPNDWEVFTNVKRNVPQDTLRSDNGFGLCALQSMNACEQDPNLVAYGGVIFDAEDINAIETFDAVQYWGMNSPYTVHVWNVNKDNQVVDFALGSSNAAVVYVGFPITNISDFANDSKLLNYVHGEVQLGEGANIDALYDEWIAAKQTQNKQAIKVYTVIAVHPKDN